VFRQKACGWNYCGTICRNRIGWGADEGRVFRLFTKFADASFPFDLFEYMAYSRDCRVRQQIELQVSVLSSWRMPSSSHRLIEIHGDAGFKSQILKEFSNSRTNFTTTARIRQGVVHTNLSVVIPFTNAANSHRSSRATPRHFFSGGRATAGGI
jgi:hypothetical protein